MKEVGLVYTPENLRLIAAGVKTQTRRGNGLAGLDSAITADWDDGMKAWVFCDANGYAVGKRKCPYGSPQAEPTTYYPKEAVQIVHPGDNGKMLIKWLLDGTTAWVDVTADDIEKIYDRKKGWESPTTGMFMLKSFARTWLPGVRTWPERLGDMSNLNAICEGVSQQQNMETVQNRYGFHALDLWSYESPVDAYRMLWESINGSWDPARWIWAIEFQPPATGKPG